MVFNKNYFLAIYVEIIGDFDKTYRIVIAVAVYR